MDVPATLTLDQDGKITLPETVRHRYFPGTVRVEPSAHYGLRRPSVAPVFPMTVVDKRCIAERLGRVSETVLQHIWSAFDALTERSAAGTFEQQENK